MTQYTLEKNDEGLCLTLHSPTVDLAKESASDGERFRLSLAVGPDRVVALLSPAALQVLGLQCVAHLPSLAPQFAVPDAEEAHRLPARWLKELDDRSIQILLRECQSDTLIDFLWYMKDADLLKLMLRNLSQRAAEMLMDDLDTTWRGKNPDRALAPYAKRGRDAVQEIMTIVRRLADEGQLPDLFGSAK